MKESDLIKEVSERLQKLSIAFRYLEPVKHYKEGVQEDFYLNDNSNVITIKPMRIDKYQTSTYMQSEIYFKPISRFFIPGKALDEDEEK